MKSRISRKGTPSGMSVGVMTGAAILLVTVLSLFVSDAFPPSPGIHVHGLVRDEFGWLLQGEGASVVITADGKQVKKIPIDVKAGRFEDNYRALVPMDMDPAVHTYKKGALKAGVLFTAHVEIAGEIHLPLEVQTGMDATAEAGAIIRLDFTLGKDTDGDGLPDEWELWQLRSSDVDVDSLDDPLALLDRDGDLDSDGMTNYAEYLAGTFANMSEHTVDLRIGKMDADGWVPLHFSAVIDKAYKVEVSESLGEWKPRSFAIGDDRENLHSAWGADDTREQTLFVPTAEGDKHQYFRVSVR